jgi:biotin-dependent carboxylase-like uncharacterized protein
VTAIVITRAGPHCTVQDSGRFGMLRHGVSASGPMDAGAFARAAGWIGGAGGGGIEFTTAGIGFRIEGGVGVGFDGGDFVLKRNGQKAAWPARIMLKDGDVVEITPGASGNYGYLRFDREFDLPVLMGSQATNSVAGLGGFEGRALKAGDRLEFGAAVERSGAGGIHPHKAPVTEGLIRVTWGLHADLFDAAMRARFIEAAFAVSTRIDRMGARLTDPGGVFAGTPPLSLVSDAIVPGDIQILGDGTPIVLLRDHQPTGGYPRIATVISADLDRFAQLRPGAEVRFEPVTLAHAHAILSGR